MHQSVIDRWEEFSTPLEGRVYSMYADVKGLITTGVGNLIDPLSLALQLPWKHEGSGASATMAEIESAWRELKSQAAHFAKLHWKYAAKLNDLRLTDADVDALVERKRNEFAAHLTQFHFADFERFPADAQLGILSMAWACGPGFPAKFGNFKRAVLAGDWNAAALTCKIRDGLDTPSKADDNPGIVPRNKNNRMLFLNAARVVANGIDDHHVLYWPDVAPNAGDTEAEAKENAEVAMAHFIAVERERFLNEGASAARDLRDWEEPDEEQAA